jgi:hypothetical protein
VGSVGIEAQGRPELLSSFYLTDAKTRSTTFEHQKASHTYTVPKAIHLSPLLFNVVTADDVRGENCKVRQAIIMNKRKAVIMLFRVGGRTAVEEFIAYEGSIIEVASALKCLGITMQATGRMYSKTGRLQPFWPCRIKENKFAPTKRSNETLQCKNNADFSIRTKLGVGHLRPLSSKPYYLLMFINKTDSQCT